MLTKTAATSNELPPLEEEEFFDAVESGKEEKNGPGGRHSNATEQPDDTNTQKDGKAENDEAGCSWHQKAELVYVMMFGALGEMLRVFLGRFFGSDCSKGESLAPNDFLEPLLGDICVTNSGTTNQTGGALFTDLPANMIGCWVMGMLCPPSNRKQQHALPWFHPHHHLQKHSALITGLRTGFCGCLTTFASWNAQMVIMLDGSDTVLGPQVVSALCGYVLGLSGCVAFFLLGQCTHEWLTNTHILECHEDEDASKKDDNDNHEKDSLQAGVAFREWKGVPSWWKWTSFCFNVFIGPPLFVVGLFAGFLYGGIAKDIQFYQELTVGTAMAPFGALLRWRLADWNQKAGPWPKYRWVPWGTLIANMVASICSVAIAAIENRYLPDYDVPWTSELLPAIKVGFMGSLSTVSTLVKEMCGMPHTNHKNGTWQAFCYGTGSLTMAMLVGLLVYSPIVRSR